MTTTMTMVCTLLTFFLLFITPLNGAGVRGDGASGLRALKKKEKEEEDSDNGRTDGASSPCQPKTGGIQTMELFGEDANTFSQHVDDPCGDNVKVDSDRDGGNCLSLGYLESLHTDIRETAQCTSNAFCEAENGPGAMCRYHPGTPWKLECDTAEEPFGGALWVCSDDGTSDIAIP